MTLNQSIPIDLWSLYALMKKSRLVEEAVTQLWDDGLISGEMHLGTGEEAIIAGVVSQLRPDDGMAVDHRGTAAFLMRGVDPVSLLREMFGHPDGLCGGQGGHMHLFSKEHTAASSGIVGAGGPTAVGFALAAQHLRPGSIAVAFFGEGAMDQGMLMESINLAAVWNLPVVFVCKDDGWAITTQPSAATNNQMAQRVRGLGVNYLEVDGLDIEQVWQAAQQAMERARSGKGSSLLHARCVHLEGHFLGLLLLQITRDPLRKLPRVARTMVQSFLHPRGASLRQRLAGLRYVLSTILATLRDPRRSATNDPVARTRTLLMSEPERLEQLDTLIKREVDAILASALGEVVT